MSMYRFWPLEGGPGHARVVVSKDEALISTDLKAGLEVPERIERVQCLLPSSHRARSGCGVSAERDRYQAASFRYPHACESDTRPRDHRRR